MTSFSREEIARREIGQTDITPVVAWMLILGFLATLVAVPAIQLAGELGSVSDRAVPSSLSMAAMLPDVASTLLKTEGGAVDKITAANSRLLKTINEYEDRLEEESWLADRLLPRTQLLLTQWGGVGNEKAYVGQDGWLFYRPGVDYLTGHGFLVPDVLAQRAAAGNEYSRSPEPDPRPAILEFHRQLAERGIRLVVMPTPIKPMLEPEHFSRRYAASDVLQNASYESFLDELDRAGVLVFDPSAGLAKRKQATGEPQFLQTDTHWTPAAMQFVAEELRTFLAQHVDLPPQEPSAIASRAVAITNQGDIAAMMQFPADQELFPAQTVTIRQIVQRDGRLWEPDAAADVLLLGDSFTNIYSMPGLNWGEAAGLSEQLSFVMQRPLDRIVQNDAGAYATRQTLARELAGRRDRLAGKRVVIWQFAMRELAVGDWKRIPLTRPPAYPAEVDPTEPEGRPSPPSSPSGDQWLVEGRVVKAAGVPQPGSVPYRDAVTALHLSDVTATGGKAPGNEAIVYVWGMRDNRWTEAARYRPGQRLKLKLTPWEAVQQAYGRFTRIELDDPDFVFIDLPTYWAEELSPR